MLTKNMKYNRQQPHYIRNKKKDCHNRTGTRRGRRADRASWNGVKRKTIEESKTTRTVKPERDNRANKKEHESIAKSQTNAEYT